MEKICQGKTFTFVIVYIEKKTRVVGNPIGTNRAPLVAGLLYTTTKEVSFS